MIRPNCSTGRALAVSAVALTVQTAAMPRPRSTRPKFSMTRFSMFSSAEAALAVQPEQDRPAEHQWIPALARARFHPNAGMPLDFPQEVIETTGECQRSLEQSQHRK